MASVRQLNANRRNARRSTGPKTDEGKHCSSRNNLKHGLYSDDVVLSGENLDDYFALTAEIEDEFKPATPTEEYLVHTIAAARWRLIRVLKTQKGVYERKIKSALANPHYKGAPTLPTGEKDPDAEWCYLLGDVAWTDAKFHNVFEKVSREEDRLHRRILRAVTELRKLQKVRREQESTDSAVNDLRENDDSKPIPKSDTAGGPPKAPVRPVPNPFVTIHRPPESSFDGPITQNQPKEASPTPTD